jgi:hypothetical protein
MDLVVALQRAQITLDKGRMEILEKFPLDFQAIATAEFMEEGRRPKGSKSSKLYEITGSLVRSLLKGQAGNIFKVDDGVLNFGTEVKSKNGFLYASYHEENDKPFFQPSLDKYESDVLPKRLQLLLDRVMQEFNNG